jgi:hypothetical protein
VLADISFFFGGEIGVDIGVSVVFRGFGKSFAGLVCVRVVTGIVGGRFFGYRRY